jgi:hypothetical protein
MAQVPDSVQRMWTNGAFVTAFTLLTPISVAQGSKIGSQKLEDKGFGNRTVIGIALVPADGDGTQSVGKSASNSDILLYAQCALAHISFLDSQNKTIVEDLPLVCLIPPVGRQYVPFYLENFNPGKSSLKWATALGNTDIVNMQLVLYCL